VQSNYIPWKGYFDLIASVDEFVLLDDVQYTKRNWRNRNRVKTASGLRWLSIPVHTKAHYSQRIEEIRIADPRWARSHWDAIAQAYRPAPHFRSVAAWLEPLYRSLASVKMLSQVNHALITRVCEALGIDTRITWASDYETESGLSEHLLSICQALGANEYVSGPTAMAYLDVEVFERAGVSVSWFSYDGYLPYPQLHGAFEHQVSVIDLLFCAGERSREFLKGQWLTAAAASSDTSRSS
jgi:hypothetical protein